MTSHDREFMNRLVSKIAEIDGGEIITYSGDYDFYERERAVRESNQQAAFARQQSMLAKEQRLLLSLPNLLLSFIPSIYAVFRVIQPVFFLVCFIPACRSRSRLSWTPSGTP